MGARRRYPAAYTGAERAIHFMKPAILSLSDPKVAAIVADLPALQRWEILRQSSSPMSVNQLATACCVPRELMQSTLDRLVDAGFALRMRATATRRNITYRSVSERVVIEWSNNSTSERAVVEASTRANTEHAREVIDRARAAPALRTKAMHWLDGVCIQSFTLEERREVVQVLTEAWLRIAAIGKRARARVGSGQPAVQDATARGYLAQIVLQPLDQPELPMPEYDLLSKRSAAAQVGRLLGSPETILSRREQEVVRRLAAGKSRPQVAAELNLSSNTLTTMTKRIYAKLGVHSKAELVARVLKG